MQLGWLGGRRATLLALGVWALMLSGCASATQQETRAGGETIVHSGPNPLGWALLFIGIGVGGVVLVVLLVALPAAIISALRDPADGRTALETAALILAVPASLALVVGFAWLFSKATIERFHSTTVTASRQASQITVERTRLVGGAETRVWRLRDIAAVDFTYVPPTQEDPAYGSVSIRPSGKPPTRIFDGEACPARDLAEAITKATGVPVHVDSGSPVVTSAGALLSRVRCGIQDRGRPTTEDFPWWAIGLSVILIAGSYALRGALKRRG